MARQLDPVGWSVRFKIHPGQLDAFLDIARGAVGAVEPAEPGLVVYQWLLSEDQTGCEVHLWFTDQEAAIGHLNGVAPQKYLPKALELADLAGFEVYGTPGPELGKALESFPVSSRNARAAGFMRSAN